MSEVEEQKITRVPIDSVVPLPYNVCKIEPAIDLMLRTDMTRTESKGINKIDPVLLRKLTPEETEEYKKEGNYTAQFQIVDGHSRWQAARGLGWNNIRAIITDMTMEEAREFNYKKNKVRGTVHPLREAAYFHYLHDIQKMKTDDIAERFGITLRRVEQILKRLKITDKTKAIIKSETGFALSGSHYEILGSVEQPEKQEQLAEIIVEQKLSRRQAEEAKKAVEEGASKEEALKRAKAQPKKKEKIDTGFKFECPRCHNTYMLIHIDPDKHQFEKVAT